MKNSQCIRVTLIMAVVLPMAVAQTLPQQTVLTTGSAVVSDVKGEVAFKSPQGTPVRAQRGSTLMPESRIETAKGSVLLELQDLSQVLVRSNSIVTLKAPNEGKGYSLEQFIGKILVKVQKHLSNSPSFRMGTPSAVITVRGTRFEVEVNKKGKTIVEVFEGLVEVAGIKEGSPHVLIKPGFLTSVQVDGAPEQPRGMNPQEGPERGREPEGPGGPEDHPRNQPRTQPPDQHSEGKPD